MRVCARVCIGICLFDDDDVAFIHCCGKLLGCLKQTPANQPTDRQTDQAHNEILCYKMQDVRMNTYKRIYLFMHTHTHTFSNIHLNMDYGALFILIGIRLMVLLLLLLLLFAVSGYHNVK